jgi:hypothetical protein
MAPSSSSTRKLAKVARSSKGSSIRERQSRGFPLTIAAIVVLGVLLVVYGRSQRVDAQDEPPRLGGRDHWHAAFGVYTCDKFQTPPSDKQGDKVGIHTHDDGIIHIHPTSSLAAGDRAQIGRFFDEVGIDVSGGKLTLPDKTVYESGKTTCANDKVGKLVLAEWQHADDAAAAPKLITSDITSARFDNDRMAFTLAFVPEDEFPNIPRPESIPTLDSLSDVPGAAPPTVPAAGSSTIPADGSSTTAPADSGSTTTAPADSGSTTTAPADSGSTTAPAAPATSTG